MDAISWAKEFIGAGGTRERWLAAFDHALTQLRSGDQKKSVHGDQCSVVPASHSNRAGTDRVFTARKGQPVFVRPGREPSKSRIAAAGAVSEMLARSVLDRIKTHDGRPWGDVGVHELDDMARDGAIARGIRGSLGVLTNEQRFKKVRDLVKPRQFEIILERVKEQANAA